ncbi:MAG TPA: pyruvate kinase [Acidobacteriota bacterium]|nr:pyruvate kinase [Acidobacteriota bacterium]
MYGIRKSNISARRTKIVCTLGPSTSTRDQIKTLVQAGMDVARLNFSHGSLEEHDARISAIREVSCELGKPIGILQDLPGPKIRTGKLIGGTAKLSPGDSVVLTGQDVEGDARRFSVSYAELGREVSPGERILIDDGRIELQVQAINGGDVTCQVITGGLVREHKGVNLPETRLNVPLPTEKDLEYLRFGVVRGVDFTALSFVQSASDVDRALTEIQRLGCDTPIISKIERPQAVREIEAITSRSDAIMIARGDLGVEMDPAEVPAIQKEIIALCNRKGIPVITATQMLESMIQNPRPTRAEASDVANAVLDGSDAVMLSGETAIGDYPVEAVLMIRRIVALIEQRVSGQPREWQTPDVSQSTELAVGKSACSAADIAQAAAIVCLTKSGSTAIRISQFRPCQPILALTPSLKALNRMSLLWGVTPFLLDLPFEDLDQVIRHVLSQLTEQGIVRPGQNVVFTAGLPFGEKRTTNTVRIEQA